MVPPPQRRCPPQRGMLRWRPGLVPGVTRNLSAGGPRATSRSHPAISVGKCRLVVDECPADIALDRSPIAADVDPVKRVVLEAVPPDDRAARIHLHACK